MSEPEDGKPKHPGGRPSKYRPEFIEQARKLCLLGATDREVADFFEVTEQTLNNWKLDHPEFFESLKISKEEADGRVEKSLYRRALGYSHDAVKILVLDEFDQIEAGEKPVMRKVVHKEPFVEHYPPDTTAAIFWLKNRKPSEWRDVKAVEHSGEITQRYAVELSDEELSRIATGSGAGTTQPKSRKTKPAGVH